MLRLISIILICCIPALSAAAADERGIWDRANTAYVNNDFDSAIAGYDSIVTSGSAGYKLYYNMGNAYFKKGEIGRSILYYNKAARLAPSDSDIDHNLRLANTYVKDNIDSVPEFFLFTWLGRLAGSMSSNAWAIISLISLGALLVCVALFILLPKKNVRITTFYLGILSMLLLIISTVFSYDLKRSILDPDEAIIMNSSVAVKSSPDNNSRELFILHEGTKVDVTGLLNDWIEIRIADGNKGWIPSKAIEYI